jgi:cell division protein FtsN
MRAADLFQQYRKTINPPYSTSELVALVAALFLLFVIPLTVISSQQARDIASKAKQTKETKISALTPGKDYRVGELFIQWKPGVETKRKEILYKAYNLNKLKQAKGTEKYHVQLVQVDPTKAKQTISTLSKNKRIEKVGFLRIPDSSEQIDSKVQGLVTEAQAATLQDSMTTPEGTKIESYTTLVTAQEIYDVLKANAASLSGEIGPTLTVKVGDDFLNQTTHSYSGGSFVATVTMHTDSFVPSAPWFYAANFTTGHEYGHVFGHYYRHTVWGSSWVEYQKARGIFGDPRLESEYRWKTSEIFAEDFRQLLAAPEAWSEGPYQGNIDIPLATEIEGLQEFLCTTYQEKSGNNWPRCQRQGDTEDPVVSITSPGDGETVSGLVDVSVSATDNVAVEKVELRIDGNLLDTDFTSPYLFSWDTTQEANNSHTIQAKAHDTSGNTATSTLVTVTVDNTSSTKPGDLNGDGVVNIFDLSILLSNWGTSNPDADINNDGTVNIFDLSILLSNWDG